MTEEKKLYIQFSTTSSLFGLRMMKPQKQYELEDLGHDVVSTSYKDTLYALLSSTVTV